MTGLRIRRATERDVPAVLDLAGRTLGWDPGDATAAHFAWKHFHNPFGPSELWIAESDRSVVGLRSFLRWELTGTDGRVWRAARAVDTGTDAEYRRRGVFTRLTAAGLESLRADGVDVVFNTPNALSRPANLALGWTVVGRLPAVVRPSGPRGLLALGRARAPATRGAVPCPVGEPAAEALADPARAAALLARAPAPGGLATHRTPAYLAWRYGHADLHYRLADGPDAAVVFHLRRRGAALEAVVCDTFAPPEAARALNRVHRRIARETGAHYLLGLAGPHRVRGFHRIPRTGPVLTVRDVGRAAPTTAGAWALTMGDIEGL